MVQEKLGLLLRLFFQVYHLHDLAALKRHVPLYVLLMKPKSEYLPCGAMHASGDKQFPRSLSSVTSKKSSLLENIVDVVTIGVFVVVDLNLSVAFFMARLFCCLTSLLLDPLRRLTSMAYIAVLSFRSKVCGSF